MAKQVISPEEFIAEVNKRMRQHPAFEEGMRVFLTPLGASGKTAGGYDFEGPGLVELVTSDAHAYVTSLYETDPRLSRTPQ